MALVVADSPSIRRTDHAAVLITGCGVVSSRLPLLLSSYLPPQLGSRKCTLILLSWRCRRGRESML